ncbi:Short-chain dehydrogenase/reductase SDR [Corchorus olitorius]|uniref:Short-chain dehydrogenase/reductase SDR n=1 Tax=Corchorus olitorius TaxID=93759 RepID=A0A1R3KYL4_9ROSI|nr:Short-chain dehydrogenase/reductase SDR [Corchorus olitorius]
MGSAADSSSQDKRWSLHGMTALVTGGTKGIGHAIVEELAGLGARVHTCSRTETDLNKCLLEWKAKDFDFEVTGSVCDVTSQAQRQELLSTVSSEFNGKLNILINNVGTNVAKPISEHTDEEVSFLIDTNLLSAQKLSLIAHPLLKASGAGSLVFLSSVGGLIPVSFASVYGVMKGAMNQLTKHLACEWGGDNIRVNAVAPALIRTPLSEEYFANENAVKAFISRTPIGRTGEPNEVSSVVTFLCLPAASYVTGQIVCVDGGITLNGLLFPYNIS